MIRKIIQIDEEKCNGCGLCAKACHEEAIGMVDGKATLLRDDYCDGLGNCLPACPTGAITFIEREAADFDEAAVLKNKLSKKANQWPLQIQLVPVTAPYFADADLLVAADCTAFAHKNFHQEFKKHNATIIGCPKLDQVNYSEKLSEIIQKNDLKSITIARMEVPCCGGIESAVSQAIKKSGKELPTQVLTITTDGNIKE
jgi:Fe-S-cluster-containing hydrogenase component 2